MDDYGTLEKEVGRRREKLDAFLSKSDKAFFLALLRQATKVRVCGNCGSMHITKIHKNVGAHPVRIATGRHHCMECRYEGLPILYRDYNLYERFFNHRRMRYNRGRTRMEPNYLLRQ
ncbi:MAG: hypothetical protein JW724_02535 [Candidatus Altiarchaeota archaeon]|nr:hypothetical protein [Candidatus Altiarchaeota archaeon]